MDAENDGAELTGDGNRVSSVVSLLLLVLTFVHEVPVDDLWLNGGAQLDEESSAAELLIVELLDLLDGGDPFE